jgi:protein SCO1/2
MKRRFFLGAAAAAPVTTLLLPSSDPQTAAMKTASTGSERFPNVPLMTHRGEKVRFYDDVIRGNKINIINMMYTQCPDVCGGTLVNMARAQALFGERMGREVFMYSISLDPRQDTPEVLAQHAKHLGAGPNWTFLTGKPADIERLRRALNFVDSDPAVDRDLSAHTGMVRAGNDALDRWMSCPGFAPAKQLAQSALWIGLAPAADKKQA